MDANLIALQKIAKERTVKTQNIEYDLETLVNRIRKKQIKLDPEYQRKKRWNDEASSQLIESLILNIPIPTIYLSQDIDVDEEDEGISRYSVIDGQQRLTAIFKFMTNELVLIGMGVLEPLNGYTYDELPPFLKRRLEERTIKCLRIDSTLDAQVKYDIFERLNSGAVKLEAQELRNAIYRGPFNDLVKHIARDINFLILNQINPEPTKMERHKKVQKMEDVELVLRFFSLYNNGYMSYRHGFKDFLSLNMKKFNENYNNENLELMEQEFIKTMKYIREYMGDFAFSKYRYNPETKSLMYISKFNAAVYDALAIAIADEIILKGLDEQPLSTNFIQNYLMLFKNEAFYDSVSGSVNDKKKLDFRIQKVKELILNDRTN